MLCRRSFRLNLITILQNPYTSHEYILVLIWQLGKLLSMRLVMEFKIPIITSNREMQIRSHQLTYIVTAQTFVIEPYAEFK